MSFKCEVVIVGGGPAGSAAAIWCARHGVETVLVEAQCFPRDRPGETLHPGLEPLFMQLGVLEHVLKAGFPRHRGQWVSWAGPLHFQEFGADANGPWLGFQAWRAELDSILLGHARRSGARILQPCRANNLVRESGRSVGLHTSVGEIHARFVIDASGSLHWLQRCTGMPVRRASRKLIATYGYCQDSLKSRSHVPTMLGDAEGWTWVAPVRADLIAWTQLDFRQVVRRPPEAVRGLTAESPLRGSDVTWRLIEECAGPGYFIVGDAASVLDPAASHGVLRAIMSGIFAADLASKICRGRVTESEAIQNFRHWMLDRFEHDVTRLSQLYEALRPAVSVCF